MLGMRGRGFTPVENAECYPGRRNSPKKSREDNFSEGFGRKNYYEDKSHDPSLNKMNEKTEEFDKKKTMRNNQQDEKLKKNKEGRKTYIPKDCFETEDELFSVGISSGINFDKLDNTEVSVSGENIPRKIENFKETELLPLLLTNIRKSNYKKPTPIQKYALPIILNCRDLMACAQTGSGKTAAFLIPLINMLMEKYEDSKFDGKSAAPELLIVSPTRELAIQIYVEAKKFTSGSPLKTEICYGGTDLRYQIQAVKEGCNILVGTLGRLIDFLDRGVLLLTKVRHIVIDEADKMLENQFLNNIEDIFSRLSLIRNKEHQILMFSATFPEKIQQLAIKYLKNYLFLAVGVIGSACTDVEQKFYCVSKHGKRSKLIELLEEYGSCKTLVFVERKRTADIIAAFLSEKDFPSTSMHGDRDQVLREEALNDFKCGRMSILVATAVAGRGLDIKDVSHVINFDLPKSVEEYVHRIGRTGRIGNRGLASSFFDPTVDSALAPHLLQILTRAQQVVPEFIIKASDSCVRPKVSNFGGKDIREKKNFDALEVIPTHEEEIW